MNYDELICNIKDKVVPALLQFTENIRRISGPVKELLKSLELLKPVFAEISTLAQIYQFAEKSSKEQFILVDVLPREVLIISETMDIDKLITKYFMGNELINRTILACGLDDNYLFQQAIDALNEDRYYNLVILGLTAVLDNVLSENSGQIKNVNIKTRCEAIIHKIEEKGTIVLDEMEEKDFLLFTSYPKVIEMFGQDSDFQDIEPTRLNRHWIMHGRTHRDYTKLDCIKILNMIYGTIRMGELGKEDDRRLIGVCHSRNQ